MSAIVGVNGTPIMNAEEEALAAKVKEQAAAFDTWRAGLTEPLLIQSLDVIGRTCVEQVVAMIPAQAVPSYINHVATQIGHVVDRQMIAKRAEEKIRENLAQSTPQ